VAKQSVPSVADGLDLLKKADAALQDIRLHTSPDARVDEEKYREVKRRLQEIDGRILDKVRTIMVTTSDRRGAAKLIQGLGETNRVFDYVSLALLDGTLPESPNAPWPPNEWADAAAQAEDSKGSA
jgi:tetrahydromethanopterin S-methyltransferase subunit G